MLTYFEQASLLCREPPDGIPYRPVSCAGPERFVRGGPTLTTFFLSFLVDKGREGINTTIRGAISGPPAKTPLKWRCAGVPMMAQH